MNITEIREELGLTIEELAKELDVRPGELRFWENDFGACPVQRLVELALEGLQAKVALDYVDNAITRINADNGAMDRFHAYMAERDQRLELNEFHPLNDSLYPEGILHGVKGRIAVEFYEGPTGERSAEIKSAYLPASFNQGLVGFTIVEDFGFANVLKQLWIEAGAKVHQIIATAREAGAPWAEIDAAKGWRLQ